VQIFSHEDLFLVTSKKGLHVILPALSVIFSNQTMLGAFFLPILRFAHISIDCAQIFDKSKLL